jgi:peptide/nickel transport system substrate-binding protein
MPETLTVALPTAIDPRHAPRPSNDSERIVYGHLYETLINLDCHGNVAPGLAESWNSRDGGRRWVFTLENSAAFWDGSPVTASSVAEAWSSGSGRRATRAAGINETVVEGDRQLILTFDRTRVDVPRLLADPALAVALRRSASRWPLGTGPYRPNNANAEASNTLSRVVTVRPVESGVAPLIHFHAATDSGIDARDLLEDDLDVLVTSDPAVLDYAAARSQFEDTPLPWNRTYLLLSTTRARELRGGRLVSPLSNRVVDSMARDAVRGDARGHRPPGWWDDLEGCVDPYRLLAGLPPIASGADREDQRRIVFDR